jgi:tetratricopeptide (TPR) repeat protein
MLKTQYIVLAVSIVVSVSLWLLPKVVVDNEKIEISEKSKTSKSAQTSNEKQTHQVILPEQVKSKLFELTNQFNNVLTDEAKAFEAIIPLIGAFKEANLYDSAAFYAEKLASKFDKTQYWLQAGDLYYEAFTYAVAKEKESMLGLKVREIYEKILTQTPDMPDLKVKIGMTYMTTPNPMQGIQMMREVVAKYPENKLALLNLGVLAMQSGQYDKAIVRFEKLKSIDDTDIQARFYLAICFFELKQPEKAKQEFLYIKSKETKPEILNTVNTYLDKLK